jgi:hypothetical protein
MLKSGKESEWTARFVRPMNSPHILVPVFDGRTKFQLGRYWDSPYTGDVAKGSTVMQIFTIKKGTPPGSVEKARGMPAVKHAIYLNILGIVVLAEPSETLGEAPSQEGPHDFGVNVIREVQESEEGESVGAEDPLM